MIRYIKNLLAFVGSKDTVRRATFSISAGLPAQSAMTNHPSWRSSGSQQAEQINMFIHKAQSLGDVTKKLNYYFCP